MAWPHVALSDGAIFCATLPKRLPNRPSSADSRAEPVRGERGLKGDPGDEGGGDEAASGGGDGGDGEAKGDGVAEGAESEDCSGVVS